MSNGLVPVEVVNRTSTKVNGYFRDLNKIPRGSGNEEAISDYIVNFAESLKDKSVTYDRSTHAPISGKNIYNVVVRKPATKGYEHLETVILQAHLDMVCQKTPGSTHDFKKDPISIQINGNEMKAKDTTLGADDGIGVACIMAILDNDEITHPPIEALFTSDEEADMTGAMAVDRDFIKGNRLINIDTETEGVFYYGCAGGINAEFSLPISRIEAPDNVEFYDIKISGLKGGHSGVEIHKKRANANKLIVRTLNLLSQAFENEKNSEIYLADIIGGDTKNVITPQAIAVVGVKSEYKELFEKELCTIREMFKHEYEAVETGLELTFKNTEQTCDHIFSRETMNTLVSLVMLIPNDVLAMHGKIKDLVETSSNIGVLRVEGDIIRAVSFIRSFLETKKQFVVEQMRILAGFVGANFKTDADFPNWEPVPNSDLNKRFQNTYKKVFGAEAVFESIHAGLECGHFARCFKDMEMIACGPTITGAHTTEETLYISTTEKIVNLLLNVLNGMDAEVAENDKVLLRLNAAHSDREEHEHNCQCII